MRMCMVARRFTGPGILLAILVTGQSAVAQTPPAVEASVASIRSKPRIVVHLYVDPSLNRMADWRARTDAFKAEASARNVPISNEYTNGFLSAGGTLLVRIRPRILVGGELGIIRDLEGFIVTEPISLGGIFPVSGEYGVETTTVGRNAQFVLAFYPREQSRAHLQVGAGMGQSHVVSFSRRADADGRGTGPIVSALFGNEWKMFYLAAGARFNRMSISYTRLDDVGVRNAQDFGLQESEREPNADLSGVFVRVGMTFDWFRD